ncbi:hypothetical protein ElyMa_004643500 [Elysia marginata]|uniref:Uncharacterized protein n=1 Tax=Elysia marginata TaxID=1093978 RepID=A0AAV4I094_9GAST|nr:hypothetical protein ElyMa_004643500 [Elysia marginata]
MKASTLLVALCVFALCMPGPALADNPSDLGIEIHEYKNRSDWKHLTTAIYRSAQAETSVDIAADGH